MIKYPTRSWTPVLLSALRSGVLRKALGGALGMSCYAACVVLMTDQGLLPPVTLKTTVFPLVTVLLSLLLAFRTNTAYDRWWEGRKLWGSLVNNTRNLAIFLDSALDANARALRTEFARLVSAYAAAMRDHLGDKPVMAGLKDLDTEFLKSLEALEHVPNALAARISRRLHELTRSGSLTGFELRNIKPHVAALTDVIGGCERIKNTPIPFAYASYQRHLVFWFVVAMPFGLQADYGKMTIPLTGLAFAALAGLEMLAADIEDPFGSDESDLPTTSLSKTIRRNVHEILVGQHPEDCQVPVASDDQIRVLH